VLVKTEKRTCAPGKNDVAVQVSKILPAVSPIYGVNPSIGRPALETFSVEQMGERNT
jgi:hypothetical protein